MSNNTAEKDFLIQYQRELQSIMNEIKSRSKKKIEEVDKKLIELRFKITITRLALFQSNHEKNKISVELESQLNEEKEEEDRLAKDKQALEDEPPSKEYLEAYYLHQAVGVRLNQIN
ncbi:hypothetical protein [Paenibacillus massiliensis]|uniref:hypothetical protein n=1 Tax=Paenibacillus massiliensis TaxID=225917 RepID=UPI00040FE9FD|nr:hypothetical protein [Paenibacillus massiliensis]